MAAKTIKFLLNLTLTSILILNQLYAQTTDKLNQKISKLLKEQNLTGCVWSIVDTTGKIYSDCEGLNNAETKKKFKHTDKVNVGSITKTVLAVGILHLATESIIKIDDPVNKYLPNIKFLNPWEATNPVTIRHLLNHSSGLGDMRIWHFFSTTSTPNTALSEFYDNAPKALSIQAKPGTVFSYSNMGYTILGMVIEAVTKQRYEKYLDENILKLLGIVSSPKS